MSTRVDVPGIPPMLFHRVSLYPKGTVLSFDDQQPKRVYAQLA
jgi:hypothetical protein